MPKHSWLLGFSTIALIVTNFTASANTLDGTIGLTEYQFTSATSGSAAYDTQISGGRDELQDGSGGERWDIDFLGFSVVGDKVYFGIQGGSILSGENQLGSQTLWLGDLAIDVGGDEDFEYGVMLGLNSTTGATAFDFYDVDEWSGVNIYNRTPEVNPGTTGNDHKTNFYKITEASGQTVQNVNGQFEKSTPKKLGDYSLVDNTASTVIEGYYEQGAEFGVDHVLEGVFDLGLLSMFTPEEGGEIIMYLAMSCVNDEAIVVGEISPVPLPSSVWLFGTALLGFIGFSRRTRI